MLSMCYIVGILICLLIDDEQLFRCYLLVPQFLFIYRFVIRDFSALRFHLGKLMIVLSFNYNTNIPTTVKTAATTAY